MHASLSASRSQKTHSSNQVSMHELEAVDTCIYADVCIYSWATKK